MGDKEVQEKNQFFSWSIKKMFLKLDELDQENIRKRLYISRQNLFNAKKLLREFKNYRKIINIIDSNMNDNISLRDVLLKKGYDDSKADELEKMYSEYLKVKQTISKSQQEYENVLKEFKTLVSNNDNYSQIYNNIVIRSKNMVEYVVNYYLKNVECSYEDALAVAYEGLTNAIQTFDYDFNFSFSTYAKRVIKNHIKHNFKSLTGYTLKKYLFQKDVDYYLIKLQEEKEQPLIRLEEQENFSDKQINNLFNSDDEENLYYYDEIPDDSILNVESIDPYFIDEFEYIREIADENTNLEEQEIKKLDNNSLKMVLTETLSRLSEREREMLLLYYCDQIKSMELIGKKYNVSYERVRQIIEKGKRKLRNSRYREKFQPFCEEFKFFNKQMSISQKEINEVLEKLYRLGKTNFSSSAKALFCSTSNITLDALQIEKFDILINTFLINMQLDEKKYYSISTIIYEFYYQCFDKAECGFPYKYPYGDIYRMLEKIRENDENPQDIKSLVNRPHLNNLMSGRI